jgi:hypothetical protein
MKKPLFVLIATLLFANSPGVQAVVAQSATVKGAQGQLLKVSATTAKSGSMITVSGNRFDETVGIYLAFCVVPKKGELPTPCGGGVNKAGTGESSFWISSNPPPYAIGLTDEFLPAGRFTHTVKVSKKIGKFDCTKVKCAITVRADHLRGNDRSYDMFIPVKIK